MNDNLSLSFDADYKVYELGAVIDYLEDLARLPTARKALKKYQEDLAKQQLRLVKLIWTLERDNAGTKQTTTQG